MYSIYVGSNQTGEDVIFVEDASYPNGASVEIATGFSTREEAWANSERAYSEWRKQTELKLGN